MEDGALCVLGVGISWGRAEVTGALRIALPASPEEEAGALQEFAKFALASRIPPGAEVVLGVPGAEFLMRRFETPPVKPGSLPELVGFEIERHLPGKREEFLCGWRVEGRSGGGGHRVLVGAVRTAALEKAAGLLGRANFPATSVQPEPLALAAVLARAHRGVGETLLLELGAGAVGAHLLREGTVVFSRTLPHPDTRWRDSFGGGGAESEGAAELRRGAALALAEFLLERLGRPLFRESLPGGKIPEICLTGAGANRGPLVERLREGLGVPVRVFTPWPMVRWAGPPQDLAPFRLPLALALLAGAGSAAGLELAEERQAALHRAPRLRLTAALAALLAAVLAAHLGGWALRQQRQLARLDGEIRALKVKMTEVDAVNRRVQEQRTRLRALRSTVDGRPRQAEILRELTALIPNDSYLSECSFREGGVEITGLSPAASKLLPTLEESPLFAGVEFAAPIVAQGANLERFRIRMRLEGTGG